jgi:NAD(P)-dependent dehydrogenase (short-subunit alcohol dehydrogenase family)
MKWLNGSRREDVRWPRGALAQPAWAGRRVAVIGGTNGIGRAIAPELTDGREIAIPLWWIPTLHNAAPEDREKYEINQSRTMLIWDPDQFGINDEVRIADYLAANIQRC